MFGWMFIAFAALILVLSWREWSGRRAARGLAAEGAEVVHTAIRERINDDGETKTVSWEVELTLRLALDPRQTRRNIRSFSDRREAEAWAPRQHAGTKLRMKCDPIDRTRAFLDGEEKSNNPLGFVVGVLFLVAGVAMVTGYIRT